MFILIGLFDVWFRGNIEKHIGKNQDEGNRSGHSSFYLQAGPCYISHSTFYGRKVVQSEMFHFTWVLSKKIQYHLEIGFLGLILAQDSITLLIFHTDRLSDGMVFKG